MIKIIKTIIYAILAGIPIIVLIAVLSVCLGISQELTNVLSYATGCILGIVVALHEIGKEER